MARAAFSGHGKRFSRCPGLGIGPGRTESGRGGAGPRVRVRGCSQPTSPRVLLPPWSGAGLSCHWSGIALSRSVLMAFGAGRVSNSQSVRGAGGGEVGFVAAELSSPGTSQLTCRRLHAWQGRPSSVPGGEGRVRLAACGQEGSGRPCATQRGWGSDGAVGAGQCPPCDSSAAWQRECRVWRCRPLAPSGLLLLHHGPRHDAVSLLHLATGLCTVMRAGGGGGGQPAPKPPV